ncbi:hypothetical protein V1512DRAFT_256717 [Lipomyces arxii]|uniref:uncharacterized protein n=1 Tax=Lipomyces arxii TaxID=56418 RepID=UPI0034CE2C5C
MSTAAYQTQFQPWCDSPSATSYHHKQGMSSSSRRTPSPAPTTNPHAQLKRPRSPSHSDSNLTRTRAKRRLIDSFTRLSLDSMNEVAPRRKVTEPVLHYDYWDQSKSNENADFEDGDLMDTGNAHTVFISSLDSSSSEAEAEENDKIVFVPDVERRIMDLPYALLLRQGDVYTPVPAPLPLHERETGLVLYKPKEQVIAESIAKDSKVARVRRKQSIQDLDRMTDEDNWGDDERDGDDIELDKDDEDAMEMD